MLRQFTGAIALLMLSFQSDAALLGRAPLTPGGTDYRAYYDDVFNLTWVADANLAHTMVFGGSSSGFNCCVPYGAANWYAAQNFASSMNASIYLGVITWRLPTANLNSFGMPNGTGELSDLSYYTLGNTSGLTNTGPFANIQTFTAYWTGTSFSADEAVVYGIGGGYGWNDKIPGKHFVWLVASGDAVPTPIPAATWLFGGALGALGLIRRRQAKA